ncbi:MAG: hypothetical protein ACE5D8_00125 [Fidelibacterota bacterium]
MKEFIETQREIIRYIERRDRRLKDGTVLPHKIFFLDIRVRDLTAEAVAKLISEYSFLGLS